MWSRFQTEGTLIHQYYEDTVVFKWHLCDDFLSGCQSYQEYMSGSLDCVWSSDFTCQNILITYSQFTTKQKSDDEFTFETFEFYFLPKGFVSFLYTNISSTTM